MTGALDVLSHYEFVFVLHAVWLEVLHHCPQALQQDGIYLIHVSEVSYSAKVTAMTRLFTLHNGEYEALNLCLAQGIQCD